MTWLKTTSFWPEYQNDVQPRSSSSTTCLDLGGPQRPSQPLIRTSEWSWDHLGPLIDPNMHTYKSLSNPELKSYGRENRWEYTLFLFHNMISESRGNDEKPNNFTIPIALKACVRLRHSHMRK
ncbi:hypothetical protein DVH24_034635 [Malus domestica]|uniref:Uncharacterized protein n=1 Tax=Malus domestica TaxID=3750 RepID=A0A498IZF1_MALDO|nr:hypothetical protein DVH24_034635 [Malus domestica]